MKVCAKRPNDKKGDEIVSQPKATGVLHQNEYRPITNVNQ